MGLGRAGRRPPGASCCSGVSSPRRDQRLPAHPRALRGGGKSLISLRISCNLVSWAAVTAGFGGEGLWRPVCARSAQSCAGSDPTGAARQAPLSVGLCRQESRSRQPFLPPRDLQFTTSQLRMLLQLFYGKFPVIVSVKMWSQTCLFQMV